LQAAQPEDPFAGKKGDDLRRHQYGGMEDIIQQETFSLKNRRKVCIRVWAMHLHFP
jgi:hypothetical protein